VNVGAALKVGIVAFDVPLKLKAPSLSVVENWKPLDAVRYRVDC
jgi:hypothetical protein